MLASAIDGRASAAAAVSPGATLSGFRPIRMESKDGIAMPKLTWPAPLIRPPMYSGLWDRVFQVISMAANLAGWSTTRARAERSPTTSWRGVSSAATVKGTAKASR